MSVYFRNFEYSFLSEKGKPIFVPNDKALGIGYELKKLVERQFLFDDFYYHLRPGGHVAALHQHRRNKLFAKIDLEHFFYNVGRNRVSRALRDIGIRRSGRFAKWSCVKNPYGTPSYALPYGFVQSPILSTLVLCTSSAGTFLRSLARDVTVSVYMDDISISSNEKNCLETAFSGIISALSISQLPVNRNKTLAPTDQIEVFNCFLSSMVTYVTQSRKDQFYAEPHTGASVAGFEDYCRNVERHNVMHDGQTGDDPFADLFAQLTPSPDTA